MALALLFLTGTQTAFGQHNLEKHKPTRQSLFTVKKSGISMTPGIEMVDDFPLLSTAWPKNYATVLLDICTRTTVFQLSSCLIPADAITGLSFLNHVERSILWSWKLCKSA